MDGCSVPELQVSHNTCAVLLNYCQLQRAIVHSSGMQLMFWLESLNVMSFWSLSPYASARDSAAWCCILPLPMRLGVGSVPNSTREVAQFHCSTPFASLARSEFLRSRPTVENAETLLQPMSACCSMLDYRWLVELFDAAAASLHRYSNPSMLAV